MGDLSTPVYKYASHSERAILLTMDKATRYVLLSQLSLFIFLFICFLLIPRFLLSGNEVGITNYGLHIKTIIPYSIAFIGSGTFLLLAAPLFRNRTVKKGLLLIGLLMYAVLISTYLYKVNHTLGIIHLLVSSTLLITEIIVSTWLYLFVTVSRISFFGLVISYLGFLISLVNFFDIIHILFVAEVLIALGYAVVLIRTAAIIQQTP
jgi:hypothetical protein